MTKAITIPLDGPLGEALRSYQQMNARIDKAMTIDDLDDAADAIEQRKKLAGEIASRIASRLDMQKFSERRAAR